MIAIELRNEIRKFILDRKSWLTASVGISPIVIISLLLHVQENLHLLPLGLFLSFMVFIFINSIYILVARESTVGNVIQGKDRTEERSVLKYQQLQLYAIVLKYPQLQPYAKTGLIVSVILPLTVLIIPRVVPWTGVPIIETRKVFSAQYPFESTKIVIEKGNKVEITVLGINPNWNCGRFFPTSPAGFQNEQYSDTVDPQANVCALIGSISSSSPQVYFLVGAHASFVAAEYGTLYLGCNDSIGKFADNPTNSKLTVIVVVGK